jgi:ribonuclease BN (tRNA processing enzyme)
MLCNIAYNSIDLVRARASPSVMIKAGVEHQLFDCGWLILNRLHKYTLIAVY